MLKVQRLHDGVFSVAAQRKRYVVIERVSDGGSRLEAGITQSTFELHVDHI